MNFKGLFKGGGGAKNILLNKLKDGNLEDPIKKVFIPQKRHYQKIQTLDETALFCIIYQTFVGLSLLYWDTFLN